MTNKLESIIVKLLLNFGISPNTKGYHYLRDCIFICVTTKEPINALKDALCHDSRKLSYYRMIGGKSCKTRN